MDTIVCELCKEMLVVRTTQHGALVSHRKKGCVRLAEIRLIMSKDYLLGEYVTKNRSALDISHEFGFKNTNFIDDMLRKYEIPKKKIKDVVHLDAVKNKRKETTIEKYGVDNVSRSQEIKEKIKKNTNFEEMGKKVSESLRKKTKEEWREIHKKRVKTYFKNTGFVNPTQLPHVRKKMSMSRRGFTPDEEEAWALDKLQRQISQDLYDESFFDRSLRIGIFNEQNWKCALCDIGKSDSKGKKFPLHHIDRNKNNNDRNNLIFLCNNCHGKVHGNIENFEKWKSILLELNKKIIISSVAKK